MKRRRNKAADLVERFRSTCGWCRKAIPPDTEVYGGGGKGPRGRGPLAEGRAGAAALLAGQDKTVLVAVAGLDSDARRDGYDFMYMTCSKHCAERLREAFQAELELGKRWGLA